MMNSPHTYADGSWDFRKANTKTDTHCYHNYPAMMIPQIAARLIDQYGKGAKTLFDPYCGTGTSLVEANIRSIHAHGTDVNPLARLIAETKTSRIEPQKLDGYLKAFGSFLAPLNSGMHQLHVMIPNFKNIDFWFKQETKEKLAVVKNFIDGIQDKKIRQFFFTAFSETVRDSSLTRNGEFKLFRMKEVQREKFNPDVFSIITAKLQRNRIGLESYLKKIQGNAAYAKIYGFNPSKTIDAIPKNSIDMVLTSPPYGDSKTTVAYGQFSRLANQWLGVENAHQVDNQLMGGTPRKIEKTGFDMIDKIVAQVGDSDEKRAKEVYSFYADYIRSISHVSSVVKKNGYACYVVGNRRVKNITLPTDVITKDIFEQYGFAYKKTFIRSIPHKRMPSKNSPINKIGHTSATMTKEYIVVMQKHAIDLGNLGIYTPKLFSQPSASQSP